MAKVADRNFAFELISVLQNDEPLYRQSEYIAENMRRKIQRGSYDFVKSVKGFQYVVDAANKQYKRDYNESANVPTRKYAAAIMALEFAHEEPHLQSHAATLQYQFDRYVAALGVLSAELYS